MKSELITSPPVKDKYPVLKIHLETNLIVLFVEPRKGTVVSRGVTSYMPGVVLDNWTESSYIKLPTTSKVVLSNED